MANSKKLYDFVLKMDGGIVENPYDKSDIKNMGLDWKVYEKKCQNILNKPAYIHEFMKISSGEVFCFFEELWESLKANQISDQKIANCIVDWVWTEGDKVIPSIIEIIVEVYGKDLETKFDFSHVGAINLSNEKELLSKLYEKRKELLLHKIKYATKNKQYLIALLNRIEKLQTHQ